MFLGESKGNIGKKRVKGKSSKEQFEITIYPN